MNDANPGTKVFSKKDWGIGLLILGFGLIVNAKSHPFTKMGGKLVGHVWHTTTIIMKGPEDFIFYTGLGIAILGGIITYKAYSKKTSEK